MLLANGCGRSADQPGIPPPQQGPVTLEEPPPEAAPREHGASPAEECLEMAGREDWGAALDPCTRAARDHPEDAAIQQALERARAASDEAIE